MSEPVHDHSQGSSEVSPPASKKLRELFLEAAEIQDAAARAAFLDRACGVDALLRQRLEELLAADQAAGPALAPQPGTPTVASFLAAQLTEQPGDMIGRYKLREKLGEGGCGVVYMAEQEDPVRRRVALKIIKLGMDTRSVIARFEAERQALAMMDHPNIARVLDAGATDTGRPYFVMELVGGIKITDYCEQNNITTRQRLDLFIQVCCAIQHAHQKGIIHRDIKPSNVLVATQDGVPVPKVIDFGIAKATQGKLTDETVFTAFEQFLGTPAYMSPEQTQLGGLDVDTRCDIYSLGVLLYELLTGKTPFDTKELLAAGLEAMRRAIQEKEPPTPSTRLALERSGARSGAAGKSEIGNRTSEIDRDLDWIVMKCLEKDRSRRYETANGLARDIERHLNNEPVVAGPPSQFYRFQKLVRRNRITATAIAAVAGVLVVGVIVSAWQAWRATRAQEAETRQRKHAEESEKKAMVQKQIAEAVSKFLQRDLLRQADPWQQATKIHQMGGGFVARENPTVKELLDRAATELEPEKIEAKFPGQREAQAAILMTIGESYFGIGDFDKAEQFATRASGLYRELFGDDNESTLNSLQLLARAYGASGKRTQSIELLERVRDAQAKALGAENPQTLRTIYHLAREHLQAGHRRQAIDMLEAVRDAQVKKLGPNHLDTLATEGELADVYRGLGETAKAIELLEQILQVQVKELGADHPSALHTMGRQAYAYWLAGKSPQAIDLLKKVSAIQQQKLGPNHPETLYTLCDLAEAYIRAAMLPQGIEILERVRDVRIGRLGKEHPDTLYTLNQLGGAYLEANKVSQAIELLEQVRDIQTKKLGPDHDDTLSTMNYLAGAYEDAGRMPEAIALFEQLRDTTQKLLGTNSQNAIIAQYALGDAYRKAGNPARALAPFRQAAVGIEKQKFQNLLAERSVMNLVSCLDQCHLYDEALLWIQKWSDGVKQRDGAESRTYAKALENHGVYLLRWERGAEAVDPIRECLALRERLWPDEPATSRVRGMLGDALLGAQRYDDAESVLLSAKAALTRGYRSEVERYRKACGNADPMALNGVAWLLATCEDAAVRDGPTAVTYAEKAVAATNRKDPVILDTLAAAYAETGEFEKAIDVQKEAIALAHDDSTKNEFRLRQELYAVKVPYRELPKDWGMFMANLILGKVFLRQQKYVDAEATLLSAYEGFKLGRHRANPAAKDIIRTLIELYEVTARADKLAEWRAELTQWYRGQIDEYRRAAESGDAQGLIVAWLLATCEDAAVRDGPTAVTYAVRAVAATNRKDPLLLDTLAAAYAETGDFEKAVGVEKEAMALAQSDSLREDFASRLKLYESNTPFREP